VARHRRAGIDRRGALRPALLVAVLWAAATVFGLVFAATTTVGPVVLTLSPGHGVHVGDLVALLVACSAAAVQTRRVLRPA
jgi:hypothetical protein